MKLVEKVVTIIAALALAAMMVIAVVDVGGRQLFGHPLRGASELTEICMMLVTFLLFPLVALRRMHIKIDLLEHLFSKSVLAFQTIVTGLLGAGIFALLAYQMWKTGMRSLGYGDVTMELETPIGLLFLTMAVFSGLTSVGFFASMFIRPPAASPDEADQTMVGTV